MNLTKASGTVVGPKLYGLCEGVSCLVFVRIIEDRTKTSLEKCDKTFSFHVGLKKFLIDERATIKHTWLSNIFE